MNAKRHIVRTLTVIAFLGAVSATAHSQEVSLRAWTDSTEYQIGRWITLQVDGQMPAAIDSLVPVVFDTLGPFEVLARAVTEPEIEGSTKTQTWRFRLITFEPGKAVVPSVPFAYRMPGDTLWRIARSQPLPLTLTTVQVDTAGDIKDIKPPVDAPWTWEDVLPYVVFVWLACVVAALAFLYVHYKNKKAEQPVAAPIRPAIPAHEAAINALRQLEDRHLWQKGKVKQYYSEATEIIRIYLEQRFGVRALEMTTDEVLQAMKRIRAADAVMSDTSKLLITADLVKFAKYAPTPDENAEELTHAYTIVRATAPKPAVVQAQKETSDVR